MPQVSKRQSLILLAFSGFQTRHAWNAFDQQIWELDSHMRYGSYGIPWGKPGMVLYGGNLALWHRHYLQVRHRARRALRNRKHKSQRNPLQTEINRGMRIRNSCSLSIRRIVRRIQATQQTKISKAHLTEALVRSTATTPNKQFPC